MARGRMRAIGGAVGVRNGGGAKAATSAKAKCCGRRARRWRVVLAAMANVVIPA